MRKTKLELEGKKKHTHTENIFNWGKVMNDTQRHSHGYEKGGTSGKVVSVYQPKIL